MNRESESSTSIYMYSVSQLSQYLCEIHEIP